MTKKVFRITNMECPMCALKLEGLEDDLPGVRHASASYRRQSLEIEFDETRLTETEVRAAIEALGYTAQDTSKK